MFEAKIKTKPSQDVLIPFNMNDEIDENEFYHQDFTTASEWEIFMARMEEMIHEWKVDLTKGTNVETSENIWIQRSERISFADVEFSLTLHVNNNALKNSFDVNEEEEAKPKHPLDGKDDFTLRQDCSNHCLSTWYGLNEFIVLSPLNNSVVITESKIKILLSSINIVAANINYDIPVFVQIRELWQNCFLGVYEGNGLRTNFEMVHLYRGPQHCQYLTGLIDLFKTKIMSPLSLDSILVSVQSTFLLTEFGAFTWRTDLSESIDEVDEKNSLLMLPLGVTVDPVSSIVLHTTWTQLPDNLVVDSENFTNFDPMQAPQWSFSATYTSQPVCLLADVLTDFLHVQDSLANYTMYDILGDFAATPPEVHNPLDLLTESKVPTISSVLKRAARSSQASNRRGQAPLSEDVLVPLLYFMFPDAEEESKYPYVDVTKKETDDNDIFSTYEQQFRGSKTCRPDSLVWRLSIILAQALHTLGGHRAMAHLWFEFVQEMRFRWEKSVLIPGLAPGFPDARTCLLHQKLQMLNCCIERKRAREIQIAKNVDPSHSDGSSTDEEEFFDCSTEKSEEERLNQKHSLWNQPVGRLGKFEDMKLLKNGDPLYIPITQDPVPKTEDQLEEDTAILLKLGSDAAGSELRARMMSASLMSDMESFKAANPGSILEDFIRWYSPRDWILDEGEDEWGQRNGHLSSRMLIADNTWMETWTTAKPVPANRQKRLFDDTREAEKVLHFLDSCNIEKITEMLIPVLAQVALHRAIEEAERTFVKLTDFQDILLQLIKSVERLSRYEKNSSRRFEAFIQDLLKLELSLSQINSLLYKINPSGSEDPELTTVVLDLLKSREVEIAGKENSKLGERLVNMFSDAQKATNLIVYDHGTPDHKPSNSAPFSQPIERNFVMRVPAHRPATYSQKSTQFLRAILTKNEFRLIGAFTEDIVFC